MMNSLLEGFPSVYAVEDEYQICAVVSSECTMWVEVDGEKYFDHSNGILRSAKYLHIAKVPIQQLDIAGKYTIHLRRINERKPYFTDYGDIESYTYNFYPIAEKESYNIINIADAHNRVAEPVKAGSYFGNDLDLLILNGDIPNDSGNIEYFKGIYQISGELTKGEKPCIFSRGNHDMRGTYAEELASYTPTDNGKSYYTFRLGPIWGIVLDTGEDKSDDSSEYGYTICCEAFRREENRFIDRVLANEEWKSYPIRLILSHNPFAKKLKPPFDIDQELYRSWCGKLAKINASVWLTGHLHECFIEEKGGEHDDYGYPCRVICSSLLKLHDDGSADYTCGAITVSNDGTVDKAVFVSCN